MNITLRQLQCVVALADQRSFRRAADAVCVTQPALSTAIAETEKALGVQLFDRTSRSVSPTQIGMEFTQGARRLLKDMDLLVLQVSDAMRTRRGRVMVSCVSSVAGRVLSRSMMTCAQRYPQMEVEIRDDVASQVLVAVRAGEADFGITVAPPRVEEDMVFEACVRDPYFLVCPRDHALARRDRVVWNDLAGQDFIAFSPTSGTYRIIQDELTRHRVSFRRHVSASHLSTVHGMLESRFGISILPALALPVSAHPTLAALPLEQPCMHREIGIYRRRDKSLSPAAVALWQIVQDILCSVPHVQPIKDQPA